MIGTEYYCKSDGITYKYVKSITKGEGKKKETYYRFRYISNVSAMERTMEITEETFNNLIKKVIWEKK